MKRVMSGVIWAVLMGLPQCHSADGSPPSKNSATIENPYQNVQIAPLMAGIEGTFVLQDKTRDLFVRFNKDRAAKRFSPCSTFKIPNTLIALETGVADGPYMEIPWDKQKHPEEPFWGELKKSAGIDWAGDQTLKSAFRNSVVWCYQELATRIGEAGMRHFLARFSYGNQDISGGIDKFWLGNSLEISADEQITFLSKLVDHRLGLSKNTEEAAWEVFETEKGAGYTLYAKTGAYAEAGKPGIGWYVGIVKKAEDDYLFAFNMEASSFEEIISKRVETAKRILSALGVLPDNPSGAALIATRSVLKSIRQKTKPVSLCAPTS